VKKEDNKRSRFEEKYVELANPKVRSHELSALRQPIE
jgi:hypothetical protein